jgi:putative PIN family toxin of toxin-antitoxin system
MVSPIIPNMKQELVILDTNIVLSGLQSSQGLSYKILQKIANEEIQIGISVPLILEYEKVLKDHLDRSIFSDEDIDEVINYLCKVGKPIKVFYLWRPFLRDPYDDHVLEVAIAGKCEFIITYNKKDFIGIEDFGIHAVSPKEYLDRWRR